jgi:glycosyltransferase involved in cell wall biosynthesis
MPAIPERYARFADTWDMNDEVRAMLKWPYVLCVGTMDIRKNLWALSQVWQRLSQNRDITLPKLVFAGRRGSFNEDFNRLMQATGNLGGWVEIFNTASDSDLDFLYRNCLFTVMPSFYEGWGLPIGESLSYGKTGVVSQASSMPEVGLDLVEYCDPADMSSIEAACLKLIADPAHRAALEARIAQTRLRSWADVSRDLTEVLERA